MARNSRHGRLSAVLFDLDHTLLDFDRAQRTALAAACSEFGLGYSARLLARYRRINEALWAQYRAGAISSATLATRRFETLLREEGGASGNAGALNARFLDHLGERGDRLRGCRRTLLRLRRHYRLGAVTNGFDRVQRARLRAAKLDAFFEVVVTSESAGIAKPDGRILHVALEALRLSAREALYVGDEIHIDGVAAAAAGVAFCWVDRGSTKPRGAIRPRHRIESVVGLLNILER